MRSIDDVIRECCCNTSREDIVEQTKELEKTNATLKVRLEELQQQEWESATLAEKVEILHREIMQIKANDEFERKIRSFNAAIPQPSTPMPYSRW